MKRLTTKILSFILTLSLICNSSIPVFAAESYGYGETYINTKEDIEGAKRAYEALTPEAKRIFEQALIYDAETLEFHTTYIDPGFEEPAPKPQPRTTAFKDPMKVLMAELGKLSLPTSVLYSLKAVGAGMVASIADGALPVGEIILGITGAGAVAVIAANWDKVSPKWGQITAAFQKAFSAASSNISSAFSKIKESAKKEVEKKKEKKEIEDAKKKIPSRLKNRDGKVKMGEFKQRVKGGALKEKGGWYIEKDRDNHKGSQWKLKDSQRRRIASLKDTGEVVGK